MKQPWQQIRDSTFSGVVWLWVLGAVWTGFSIVTAAATSKDGPVYSWGILMVAILAAPGVLIFLSAIYLSMQRAKIGQVVFESPMLPANCGGIVAGEIRLARPLIYLEPIQLRLACVLQGDAQESPTALVWEDHCTLDRFLPEARVAEIPVHFRLPADCRPTRSGISWRLDARTKTRDGHFSATFRIPVTAGPIQPDTPEITDATVALRSPRPVRHGPVDQHIHFTPLSGGGSRTELLPGRNFLSAVFFFLFAVVCIAFAQVFRIGLKSANSTDIVATYFIFAATTIGVVMLLFGLRLVLLKTTIIVQDGIISIGNTPGLGRRRREIRAADLADITVKLQGSVQNRLFYSVSAVRRVKSPVKICGAIYDKADADWLTAEFKRELGMR